MTRFRDQLATENGVISVREIVAFFADRGIGALLFIFGAPMSIPLPMVPGVSFIFSLPLLVLAGLQVMGVTRPWMPEALARKTLSRRFTAKAMDVSIPWLLKIEKYSRARLKFMLSDLAYRWSGIVIGIMALSIMFPLPFSNAGPGAAIVVIAVGRIMHDGLMILLGSIFGLLYVAILYTTSFALVVATVRGTLSLLGVSI
jgi:hypothetical protein